MLDLDRARAPAQPKAAATVVVVRPGAQAVEVFCVERHRSSAFMGGAVVFPGGKVDPTDRLPIVRARMTGPVARAREFAADDTDARSLAFAALRELLEEAALLPVVGAAMDDEHVLPLRARWQDRSCNTSFAKFLAEEQLTLDGNTLIPFARWVTPAAESRRFDARFFLTEASANQSGAHDTHETTHSFWTTPEHVLDRSARGEVWMAPPTSSVLELLRHARSVADAIAIAERQSLAAICPHFVVDGADSILALPGDPLHPEAAPPPEDPAEPTRFVLRDGRFVPARYNP